MSTHTDENAEPLHTATGHAFAARVLETGASAIAADAADRLLSQQPTIEARLGETAFLTWKSHLTERVGELAAAVAQNTPILFTSRVAWARDAFAARGADRDDLDASLRCLRDAVSERLPETTRASVEAIIDSALTATERTDDADHELNTRALRYIQSILEGDSHTATTQVLDAVECGEVSLADAYTEILLAAQHETGRMWHRAEINIAEEHLVTATTQRTMAILAHRAGRRPNNGKTVVTAAVEGNRHDIGLVAVSDFFAMAGWRAITLGADVPPEDIAAATLHFEADLLLLSAALSTQLESLKRAIETVRAVDREPPQIMVGGAAFAEAPDLWQSLYADGHAAEAARAVDLGAALVGTGSRANYGK